MEDQEKSPPTEKVEQIVLIQHPECERTVQGRKVILSKKSDKTFKVTVRYIKISTEEVKIKRAIIENILKKGIL